MPMPEATVDEDHGLQPGEDDVGGPGEIAALQPKAETEAMEQTPHPPLGRRIGAANARHHSTARLPIDSIDHGRDPPGRPESITREAGERSVITRRRGGS